MNASASDSSPPPSPVGSLSGVYRICRTPEIRSVTESLECKRMRIERWLRTWMPDDGRTNLGRAMRYTLLTAGKRLHGALCLAANEACDGPDESALNAACALEMIHAMAVILDDLPAVKGSAAEGEPPANHDVYGEATAILAGDALLGAAFELLSAPCDPVDGETRVRVIQRVARAVSIHGLTGGQALDVTGSKGDYGVVREIHLKKAAALFEVAAAAGAILAGAADVRVDRLARYGRFFGMAVHCRATLEAGLCDGAGDAFDEDGTRAALDAWVEAALGELTPYGHRAEQLRIAVEGLRSQPVGDRRLA